MEIEKTKNGKTIKLHDIINNEIGESGIVINIVNPTLVDVQWEDGEVTPELIKFLIKV